MLNTLLNTAEEPIADQLGPLSGASARPPRRWGALKALRARPLSQPHEWASTSGRTYPLRLAGRRWALSLSPEVWAGRLRLEPPLTPIDAGEVRRYEALRRSLPSDWLKPLMSCVAVSVADELERGVGASGVGPLISLSERSDELSAWGLAHSLMGLNLRRDPEAEELLRLSRALCAEAWASADPWEASAVDLGRGFISGRPWRALCERLERLSGSSPRLSALLSALGDPSAPPTSNLSNLSNLTERPSSALLKIYAQLTRDVSYACQWIWIHTSNAPRWREALAQEVRGALKEQPYSADALSRLPALRAVLLEQQRLYPPVWREAYSASSARSSATHGARRAPPEPVELDGLTLAPHTLLASLPFWLHRDERAWGEPARWSPERWLALEGVSGEERLSLRPAPGLFAPFGLGALHDPARSPPTPPTPPTPLSPSSARDEIWTHAVSATLTSVLRRGAYEVQLERVTPLGETQAEEAQRPITPALRAGALSPPSTLSAAFCVSERLTYIPSERL
jgi:hypothetical protein